MAKKNKKTFASRAKIIQAKYKNRENDPMSEEAMERELQSLMQEQETYKAENNKQNDTPEFKDGGGLNDFVDYNTYFQNKTSEGNPFYVTRSTTKTANNPDFREFSPGMVSFSNEKYIPDYGNVRLASYDKKSNVVNFMADQTGDSSKSRAASEGRLTNADLNFESMMPQKKNGGKLKKYSGTGNFSSFLDDEEIISDQADKDAAYWRQENPQEFNNLYSNSNSNGSYDPSYNWVSPTANTITNTLSNYLSSKSRQKSKDKLLSQADNINLGRIAPQKIDLGRQRSSILQNRDLTTAAGRRRAGSSTSVAESANIERASRLGASRIAGDQLGKSFTQEELANMQSRQRADEYNANMKSQEAQLSNRNRMMIEQQYGNPSQDWIPQTIKSTGQNYTNALAEQNKQKEYYDYLNMLSRNYYLDKNKQLTNR